MSFWILPESGIIISCTTVQRISNLEKQTDEYTRRMNDFQIKLEEKWTTTLSDILGQSQDGPRKNVVYLEDEDEEFVTEFKRAIDNEDVKDADDDNSNEIGIKDPYLNM